MDTGCETLAPVSIQESGILGRLKNNKASLEARLEKVNAALAALEANPEIAKVMELVAKAS